jgi:hypothetical protein
MTAPRFFAGDAVDPTTEVVSAADYDEMAEVLAELLYACDSPSLIVKARAALAKAGVRS